MKRICITALFALLLVFPTGLKAQKNTNEAIAKIRKIYAEAMDKINSAGEYYKEQDFIDHTTIQAVEMWPGSGPHQETKDFYYILDLDEETSLSRHLFFVRIKYNVAVQEYYFEFLYDENENLVFYYTKQNLYEYDGEPVECRFYYDNGKLIKTICTDKWKVEEMPNAQGVYKKALQYRDFIKDSDGF